VRFGGLAAALSQVGSLTLVVVLTVIVSRLLWVAGGSGLLRLRQRHGGRPPPPVAVRLVIGWAGMRGVVSLAAALALPRNFPGRDAVLFATFAVIAVTVLLQGSTLAPLIRLLARRGGLEPDAPNTDESTARLRLSKASLQYLQELPQAETDRATHAPLIELYRQRLEMGLKASENSDVTAQVFRSRMQAALAAVSAGRDELLHLHHEGEVHESVLQKLELELDLEELRLRQIGGQGE
jgi:monovalent cation/hydrogen antiporter